MPITRSFVNGNEVTDWTQEINLVPRSHGLLAQLGIFEEVPTAADTVSFDVITGNEGLVGDKVRGNRAYVGKDDTRQTRTWPVPHYPVDDYLVPGDVRGKRAYGSPDQEDALAAKRAQKIAKLSRRQQETLEYARGYLLTTGGVYAPNGSVSLNYFTEFGVSQTTVSFALGTGSTQVLSKQESAIRALQDATQGSSFTNIIAIASPEFFTAYTTHASVQAAYSQYQSSQEPLRNRLGPITSFYRQFTHGNVTLIEDTDTIAGNRVIDANSAYFIPVGSDVFKTYFGPANKFDLLGTLGEPMYMFEYASPKGDKIEIETESNFLNAVTKPGVIIKATVS